MKRPHAIMFLLLAALTTGGCQTSSQPSLLFVQVAQSGALEAVNGSTVDYTLELTGVHPEVVYFADRPQRSAGSVTTEQFLDAWSRGSDSFADDPPNAAVAMQGRDDMLVLELSAPVRHGDTLRYTARMLDDLPSLAIATSRPAVPPRDLGRVVLFIDNFNQMNGVSDPMNRPDNFGRESFGGGDDPMNRPDNFGR